MPDELELLLLELLLVLVPPLEVLPELAVPVEPPVLELVLVALPDDELAAAVDEAVLDVLAAVEEAVEGVVPSTLGEQATADTLISRLASKE